MRRTLLSAALLALAGITTLAVRPAAAEPRADAELVYRAGAIAPDVSVAASASDVELANAAIDVTHALSPSTIGVSWAAARLTHLSSGDRIVKLPQVHAGIVVANRGAVVAFRGGAARFASARVESDFPESAVPSVDEATARETARASAGLGSELSTLVWWPSAEGVRLAWAVLAEGMPGFAHRPVTIVDAVTGEVIVSYETIKSLDQANVYPTNPEKSPTTMQVTLPRGAGEATLKNTLIESRNCIDMKTVKSINVGVAIDVHVCDLIATAVADANGDFLIPPASDTEPEDAYAEISMFHHANRAYAMFRQWDPALDVNGAKPLITVSNLRIPQGFDTFDLAKIKDPNLPLAPFQNAFYAPADPLFSTVFGLQGGAMWFGQGPLRDYSYDGDVVYHEFGHAVVGATVNLIGTPHMDALGAEYSPGGMNEGLADYFSSALTGDPDVGEYASKDFAPGSVAIRSLTADDKCPTAIGGEVHQDATLFSGGLWDVRATLAPADQLKFDESVFAALNVAPTGDLGYGDLATIIVNEVKEGVSQAAADALTAAWTTRGVLPSCRRILEFTGTPLKGPPELQSLWFAPGTQTTGAKNAAGGWTPGVIQTHFTMPANSGKLTVTFTEVNVGGGGNPLSMGTPFKAKLLVRFGADPVQFTYKPTATTDDVLAVDTMKSGQQHTATIDVPAGATEVYVMVGSTGQLDGAYTNLAMSAEPAVPMGSGGAGGTGATSSTTGSGGGPSEDSGDGCGCEVPGAPSSDNAWFAALGLVGFFALRRARSMSSRRRA